MTDFISTQVFYATIKVIPRVQYTFQVIAREDKGIRGIDYNKSKLSTFKTSRFNSNNQPPSLPRPLNSNDPKLDYGNIQGPPPVPEAVSLEHIILMDASIIVSLLICTLISENQGLEKLGSVSNLRKISGPAHLIFFSVHLSFFSVCHLDFFRFMV